MLDASKAYDFTIDFGAETDTLDAEGQGDRDQRHASDAGRDRAVPAAVHRPDRQVPPAYSAIKIDGQRAYDLARAGEDVEMKRA